MTNKLWGKVVLFCSALFLVSAFFVINAGAVSASSGITQRGSTTTAIGTTSLTINKPIGVVAGDVMIANINIKGGNTFPSLVGWTTIATTSIELDKNGNPTTGGKYHRNALLYRIADGSEGSSFTFTFSATLPEDIMGAIVAFSGVDIASGPFDVTPGSWTYGAESTSIAGVTSITTVSSNAMVLMFVGAFDNATSVSAFSTTTVGALNAGSYSNANASGTIGAGWATKSTGSTGTGTATLGEKKKWGAILIALKPISKITPTLSVTNSPATYNGSAQSATVTGSTVGTVSNIKYDGSLTVPTNAGTYAITADFTPTDTATYNSLTNASAGNFVINKVDSVTTVTGGTFVYNGNSHAANVSVTGPGGLSLTPSPVYSGSCSVAPTTVVEGASCTASYNYAGDTNYNPSSDSKTITITPLAITVTADANGKMYGNAEPLLTYSHTGNLVVGDSFGGALSRDPGEDVGNYNITKGDLSLSGNYNLVFVGNTFSITQKQFLTVTADNISINYGQTDPSFTFAYSGFVNEDNASVVDVPPTCSVSVTHTNAGDYPIICSGASDNNYDFRYVSGTLTIKPVDAVITVTPYDVSYDGAPHTATVTATGVSQEDLSSYVNLTATTHTNAGNYVEDSWTFKDLAGNYNDATGSVNDKINQVALTITASDGTMTKGESVPNITATYSGFVGQDTENSLATKPVCSTTATSFSDVGAYPSTCSEAITGNYIITYKDGVVTVNPASSQGGSGSGGGGAPVGGGVNLSNASFNPDFGKSQTQPTGAVPQVAGASTVAPETTAPAITTNNNPVNPPIQAPILPQSSGSSDYTAPEPTYLPQPSESENSQTQSPEQVSSSENPQIAPLAQDNSNQPASVSGATGLTAIWDWIKANLIWDIIIIIAIILAYMLGRELYTGSRSK